MTGGMGRRDCENHPMMRGKTAAGQRTTTRILHFRRQIGMPLASVLTNAEDLINRSNDTPYERFQRSHPLLISGKS